MEQLNSEERVALAKYARSHRKIGYPEPKRNTVSWVMLNLLEQITEKKRDAIRRDFTRKGLKSYDYKDVSDYVESFLFRGD